MIKFNGKVIAPPIMESFKRLEQVIFQEEGTGRNQKGDMVLTVIGRAEQINLEWKYITKKELRVIVGELRKIVVNVSMKDEITDEMKTREFYCSEIPLSKIETTSGDLYNLSVELTSMGVL